MLMSQTIGALAAALAKAQVMFKPAIKDAKNPFFNSKYCDLQGAIDATREALSSNELAVIQTTLLEEGELRLYTTLAHSSSEFMTGVYPIRPMKAERGQPPRPDETPQGFGSALTYARRYCYMAAIGLASEDDDGEAAQGRGEGKVPAATIRKAAGMPPERDEARIAQDVEEIFGPDEPGAESEPAGLINEGQMRLLKASVKRFKIPLKRAKGLVVKIAGTEDLDSIPADKVEAVMAAFAAEGNVTAEVPA